MRVFLFFLLFIGLLKHDFVGNKTHLLSTNKDFIISDEKVIHLRYWSCFCKNGHFLIWIILITVCSITADKTLIIHVTIVWNENIILSKDGSGIGHASNGMLWVLNWKLMRRQMIWILNGEDERKGVVVVLIYGFLAWNELHTLTCPWNKGITSKQNICRVVSCFDHDDGFSLVVTYVMEGFGRELVLRSPRK